MGKTSVRGALGTSVPFGNEVAFSELQLRRCSTGAARSAMWNSFEDLREDPRLDCQLGFRRGAWRSAAGNRVFCAEGGV